MKRYIKPTTTLTLITEATSLLIMSGDKFNPNALAGGGSYGDYDTGNPQLSKDWNDVFIIENEEGLPCFSVWED